MLLHPETLLCNCPVFGGKVNGLPDELTGYPLIRLNTIRRFSRHNDQLLSRALEKDGYSDSGNRNGAFSLVSGEPSCG